MTLIEVLTVAIILIIIGLVAFVAVTNTAVLTQDCSVYANWAMNQVPVRCFNYFGIK